MNPRPSMTITPPIRNCRFFFNSNIKTHGYDQQNVDLILMFVPFHDRESTNAKLGLDMRASTV